MSKVIKIIASTTAASAQVTLSSGQVACLNISDRRAYPQMLKDAENGELAEYIERYADDTPAQIAADLAQADDWTTVYQL